MVMAALSNDLKPTIEVQRRLVARWSRSTILLRDLRLLTSTQPATSDLPDEAIVGSMARHMGPSSVTFRRPIVWPGKSELIPVKSAAAMTLPAINS